MEEVENHHLLITEERNLYKKYISPYTTSVEMVSQIIKG